MVNNNINKFKLEHGYDTSEELFGIPEPSEHQCPKIDEIKKNIIESYDLLRKGIQFNDYDVLLYNSEQAKDNLSTLDYDVEDLRQAIMEAREWGMAWKELAKRLINDLPEDVIREELGVEKVI